MFEAIPRYHEAARCWHDRGMVIGVTGWASATFNAAIIDEEFDLTAGRIGYLADLFQGIGVSYTIQVAAPSPVPACAELLWDAGFGELLCDPMLIYEGSYAPLTLNPDVHLQRVVSQTDIALYYQIVAEGFELPAAPEDFVAVMLRMDECTHLIAWLNGVPVGAGTLVECAGVAGIYNVATVPLARGQGVATALMHGLHAIALADGYSGTALASSVMGLPLYRKLGYRPDGYQVVYARAG